MRRDVFRGWALTACVVASSSVWANMADNSHRSHTAGVDLITYQTQVKQVVAILGSMPAGDAMATGSDNIAIPTLTGMMLDRGTKRLDKYAIAEQLDNVGAEISFAVGTQSLEIRAKCLDKDLPLVLGLLASELRTPAFAAAEFVKAKQQFIGSLQESLQHTDGRAQEAFARNISRRPSESSAFDCGVSRRGQIRHSRWGQGVPREVLWSGAPDAGPGRRCAGGACAS